MTDLQTRYRVEGMDCASCAAKITNAVRRVPGVEDVSVSVTSGTMMVSHAETPGLGAAILRQVNGLGEYRATAWEKQPVSAGAAPVHDHSASAQAHAHDHGAEGAGPWWRSRKGLLTIAGGLALAVAYAVSRVAPATEHWAFVAAMLVSLVPIARRAVVAARYGSPFSIEMLVTLGAVGASIIGAGMEGAMVVFLFLVGELLEGVAASKARAGIQGLTELVPKTVLVERSGGAVDVPAESVAVGAIVIARPGERIGADGEIVEGDSSIDEAPVTGESTPVRKGPGAVVFAGTINIDAVLRIRVTAAAADNTIARVVRLVEEAQESKTPIERFIDRFSRYYTPGVVAVAALIAIVPPLLFGAAWVTWIYKGLAILLIGCPCALVLSTPAAIAAALSAGARRGLLVKGGAVLESLGRITAIALDKTGTLTEGKPKVTDIVAFGRTEKQVLSMAAALEAGSSHPLARAILERARADGVPVPPAADARAVAGKGVEGRIGGEALYLASASAAGERAALSAGQSGQIIELNEAGKTVSVLLAGQSVVGLIAMRDEPRSDARAGIDALKAAGITPVMLTGDNRRTADAIARLLGLEARAELLPEDKQRIVREMQSQGKCVAKVGDGINDAPALAAADVGIAMGGGTDVALETAGAAILHGRVLDLARLVSLSRTTLAIVRQNITIALGLKAVFLVTTIAGLTGLWPAILADTGATVLVTANAMRLLALKGDYR